MKTYIKLYRLQLSLALVLLAGVMVGLIDPALAMGAGMALTTTTGQLANGTVVQVSAGSPTAFVVVNNVDNVNFDTGSSAKVDMTNLTSSWKEFLLGLPDPGSLTFDLDTDFADAGQAALRAARIARTKCDFKVVLPGGPTPTFTMIGYVMKFPLALGVDKSVKTSVECLITGPIAQS